MKRGFTLVELLGVITILALIMLVIAPVVNDVISDSRKKTYQQQVDVIEKVAKQWGVENLDALPEPTSGKVMVVTLETLLNSGKIQNSSIIDPRTREEMTGCVIVSYNSEYNQYEYNYNEDTSYCENVEK